MNPTPNDNLDAQSEEKVSGDTHIHNAQSEEKVSGDTHIQNVLEGELKGPSVLPLAIACLSTGLFLGSFFTKKAPISLVISSV